MKKCLIVDDEEQNRYLLEVLLRGHGYEVASAENGAEALEKARSQPPDIIITDILMPVMDGFTLCKEWKRDKRLRGIPLIIYTATYTNAKDEALALSLGADRFLVKPQSPEVLVEEIKYILARAAAGSFTGAGHAMGDNDFLRRHYEVIIRKIEDKMAELQDLNARLTQEITAKEKAQAALEEEKQILIRAEQEIGRLNADLERRVLQRTAQLEAANEELEAFSYSVSHDLRAPLRVIDGFSKALREDYENKPLDDTGRNNLERIGKASQLMGRLIEDLLKLSRVTRSEFTNAPIDLSRMVQALADKLRQDNPHRLLEVVIEEGVIIEGDYRLMEIAIGNLLDNAWKFTGKVAHPRVEFGSLRQDGKTVYYLRDNGAGFNPTYGDKLFGAFQRLHSQKEFPGTGIGLATVKRIVSRHGGRVWAEGAVGKGATFYFTIA
jgi:signal transduction histidine kinase